MNHPHPTSGHPLPHRGRGEGAGSWGGRANNCFNSLDQLLQPPTVFDEVLAGLDVGSFGIGVVEDDDHVRFDGDAAVVAAREGIFEDVAHAALAFTGPVVSRVVFRRVPSGVLDVNVYDLV